MDVFAPSRQASLPSAKSFTDAVDVVKFGDGYEQSKPDGINPRREMWRLVFDGLLQADVDYIEAFAAGHVGITFLYAVADGVQKKWQIVPGSMSVAAKAGLRSTVNFSIKQVFL